MAGVTAHSGVCEKRKRTKALPRATLSQPPEAGKTEPQSILNTATWRGEGKSKDRPCPSIRIEHQRSRPCPGPKTTTSSFSAALAVAGKLLSWTLAAEGKRVAVVERKYVERHAC